MKLNFQTSIYDFVTGEDKRSILIAVQGNEGKQNVVIGFSSRSKVKPAKGNVDRKNQKVSEMIKSMQSGVKGQVHYQDKMKDDSDKIFLAYAPVIVKMPYPVNSSDYYRGVEVSEFTVYSLGMVDTMFSIREPLHSVLAYNKKIFRLTIIVLIFVVFLATMVVVCISFRITNSINSGMLDILQLTKTINK